MKRILLAAVAGIAANLIAHLQTVVLWRAVYDRFPWPGYEYAMKSGDVDPSFANSPVASVVTFGILFAIGLLVLRKPSALRPVVAISYWLVSSVALVAISLMSPEARESNLLPIGMLIVLFYGTVAATSAWLVAVFISRNDKVSAGAAPWK
ncbi:MAG: hypothetical protein U0V87_04695 [Acidobacteriota bacterium]